MKRLVSSLVYLSSSILLLFFIVIFLTENTNIVSKLYKKNITSYIQNTASIKYNFEELSIKWNGLNPSLIFDNISLHNATKNQHYLSGKKLILKINFANSLIKLKLVPEEINLVSSNIDLTYNKNGIYIKDFNFLKDNEPSNTDLENIKFRVTNSNINVNNMITSHNYELLNINMVVFKQKNEVKLFTTFNHQSSKEVIHLASNLSFDRDNNINGQLYSKGNNINLSKPLALYQKLGITATNINYTFWADIENGKFVDLEANIDAFQSKITNNLTKDRLLLDNFSSKIFYKMASGTTNLSLTDLSFMTQNSKYKNNHIHITQQDKIISDISINQLNVSDLKNSLRLLAISSGSVPNTSLALIDNGVLNNIILLGINDKKNFRYGLNFSQTGFNNNGLKISNTSGTLKGNNKIGYLDLDSDDVGINYKNDTYYISSITGNLYYQYIKGKLMMSSNNIKLDDAHAAKLYGSFSPKQTNLKIDLSGNINDILSKLPSNFKLDNVARETKINSDYNIDYRIFKTGDKIYKYGAISLSNVIAKNEALDITFNTKKIRANFFDQYYQSFPSKIYINNNIFLLSIDTDISNGVTKYIANSEGVLEDAFIKSFVDHKLINSFKGETRANIQLVYQTKSKKTFVRLKSDLKGLSFNIISPFIKKAESPKDFQLTYQINEKQRNNIDIKYDLYKMQLSKSKESLFAAIESPYLSGTLVLPDNITIENRITARLKYFDLNKFQGIADPRDYPYLDMDMKRVKIYDNFFNDFKIKTSPISNGMFIDELMFVNSNLSMTGTGKWLNTDNGQITLFDARFTSNDFGKSLDNLGYKNLIKRGSLSSQLIGQWQGPPENFSLNTFDGKIMINLDNGEFLQVSKQSRAIGQLLGLFSISSLQKRLSLDFSDFFSSGLSFDNMNGEFVFLDSKAEADDLILKGSFGEMRVNGNSDLGNKTHDQKLVYIPDLSSMSLISGTLLGGPVGALASIFYDKFLEEIGIDTNQLAAVEYSIKGSWDNPEIKVTESFKPITN